MKSEKKRTANEFGGLLVSSVLTALSNATDGVLPRNELYAEIEQMCDFTEEEKAPFKNGYPRWRNVCGFYSIELQKAGYIVKQKGNWYITDAGREAATLEPIALIKKTHAEFAKWKKANKNGEATLTENTAEEIADDTNSVLALDDIREQASDGINEYLHERTPWEFQDMVAALLRTIGYYTPFIAPKGRDGGIDIIAYSDPMGATKPILKVQVKHYADDNVVSVDVVRNIIAVANPDIPVVVTSSRFTESAKIEARLHNVRLIDGSEFVDLWVENYAKMSENDKALMPIEPIFFIKRG